MPTTTIRLDEDDRRSLDELAKRHGGRSGALRAGLRLLEADDRRRETLAELVAEWEAQSGPLTQAEVDAVAEHFGL